MLQQVIDRRLSGKNKSIGNRERFLRRFRGQIRDAVRRAVAGRSLHDIEQGQDITLPRRDVSEPALGHGTGGTRESVHPGNQDYVRGDRIDRPRGGGAGGPGSGANADGTGEDDFVFRITREEFMQYFFDDLALPHLVRTQLLPDAPEWKSIAPVLFRRAHPLTCMWCARCGLHSAGALPWAVKRGGSCVSLMRNSWKHCGRRRACLTGYLR